MIFLVCVKYPDINMSSHKMFYFKIKHLVGQTGPIYGSNPVLANTSLQSLKQINSEGSDLPRISQTWETKIRPSDFCSTPRKNLEPFPKYTVCRHIRS